VCTSVSHDFDTHTTCALCVWVRSKPIQFLRELNLALFLRDVGQASVPSSLGPMVAEAKWRLKFWGS